MTARDRVVAYLFRAGPAARDEVMRGTELSRATVSKLVGEMQAQGVVVELPAAARSGRAGRPTSLLTIEPGLGAVGAIDFGHSSVRVAIADLAGTIVVESGHEFDVDNDPMGAIGLASARLLALSSRERLLGVGAAISAPVRRDSGIVVVDGILPGWSSISLRTELESRMRTTVHVGNDANLGALAEVRMGAGRGAVNVVYLMLSSGIGAGLVLDGELFTGHSGMTGELGHVVVAPGGALCRCGQRGCLETVAGAQRLRARLGGGLRTQGPAAHSAFAEAGRAIGRVAGAVCNLVNPELVIVGGELIVAGETLVAAVRAGLREAAIEPVWQDVRVTAAQLGDRAELLGAVGLALAEVDATELALAAAA
ncbi:MAG: ROK family protein [Solirubrobacteraceae bacterium]